MICSGEYGRKNVYHDAGVTLVTGYDYMMRSSTATLNDVNDGSGRFHQNMTDPGADHDHDLDPCLAVEASGYATSNETKSLNATSSRLSFDKPLVDELSVGQSGRVPYRGFAATGTALLQPTRKIDPPQSKPSNSRRAFSASLRFMNATNPLSPVVLDLRVFISEAGPVFMASPRGHMIFTYKREVSKVYMRKSCVVTHRTDWANSSEEHAKALLGDIGGQVCDEHVRCLLGMLFRRTITVREMRTSGSPRSLLPL